MLARYPQLDPTCWLLAHITTGITTTNIINYFGAGSPKFYLDAGLDMGVTLNSRNLIYDMLAHFLKNKEHDYLDEVIYMIVLNYFDPKTKQLFFDLQGKALMNALLICGADDKIDLLFTSVQNAVQSIMQHYQTELAKEGQPKSSSNQSSSSQHPERKQEDPQLPRRHQSPTSNKHPLADSDNLRLFPINDKKRKRTSEGNKSLEEEHETKRRKLA